jgi:hypothetical protein
MQDFNMKRRNTWLAIAAWVAVIAIAYATLTHAGLVYAIYFKVSPFLMRPTMETYAHFEHIIAFAFLGVLFGFAYPRRLIVVCSIVLGAAALLEILQTMTADRHGTMVDALEKMGGGALGIALARGTVRFRSRIQSHQQKNRKG